MADLIDFHSHIIPGVDDGAGTPDESLIALERMWNQGITHVITTPHFRATTLSDSAAYSTAMGRIDEAWERLIPLVREQFPQMRFDRGVELALDEPNFSLADPRLRLAGTKFALVEFPHFTVPPNSRKPLANLLKSGVTPIVAHPERYDNLTAGLEVVIEWKREGAFLQLNAGSLVGAYGPIVQTTAWRCLEWGLIDYVCSDYHARGSCLTAKAAAILDSRGGSSQFQTLTSFNGDRLLNNLAPTPVVPLPRQRSWWRRLARAVGRG